MFVTIALLYWILQGRAIGMDYNNLLLQPCHVYSIIKGRPQYFPANHQLASYTQE